ncbi:MAG TPA: efflux RND transporter periplasmic adaptor subunit [Gemmatimonadales bacterium]|jgi:multidrug efflux system membrane fusion protein
MIRVSRLCCLFALPPLVLAACHSKAATPPPPVPVAVTQVRRVDMPRMIAATGTIEPIQTAEVQAQVSGLLQHVLFKEGDEVHEGQILFEIDPRSFEAALEQAQGAQARDYASWISAQHDVARYQALAAKDYVTQQQLDQTRAMADALVGTLRTDSAMIAQARLNVQYATIRAPISGRAGSVLVKEGNQVRGGAGQTLVVINQISPIMVRFPVPAALFDAVRRRADSGLAVEARPVGDSAHVEYGKLTFLDNNVDSLTGTVLLKAIFPNADGALWPGGLDAVSLQLDVARNALVVPTAAVQNSQNGSVVWIVDSNRRAHPVKVTVARSSDSLTMLQSGVTAGETIVTDGQLRLTDSSRVSIRNPATAPTADSANATAKAGDPAPGGTGSAGARRKPRQ